MASIKETEKQLIESMLEQDASNEIYIKISTYNLAQIIKKVAKEAAHQVLYQRWVEMDKKCKEYIKLKEDGTRKI